MFSLLDMCSMLCSRDLDVLRRAQRIIVLKKILITHKSVRSDNPIPWLCTSAAHCTPEEINGGVRVRMDVHRIHIKRRVQSSLA